MSLKMINSKDMKIKLLLKGLDGTVLYIEFMENEKSKILSYDNFVARYGGETIKDLKQQVLINDFETTNLVVLKMELLKINSKY